MRSEKTSAILDTCVLLVDPDAIVRADKKSLGYPVITDVVLQEIGHNKKNKDDIVADNADKILREMEK